MLSIYFEHHMLSTTTTYLGRPPQRNITVVWIQGICQTKLHSPYGPANVRLLQVSLYEISHRKHHLPGFSSNSESYASYDAHPVPTPAPPAQQQLVSSM